MLSIPQLAVVSILLFACSLTNERVEADAAIAQTSVEAAQRPSDATDFERPGTFDPRRARSATDQKRLEAAALYSTASLHLKRKKFDKACELLAKAIELDPESSRLRAALHFGKAAQYERQSNYTQALASYQRSRQWDPENLDLLKRIVHLAQHLDRNQETARYGVLLVEQDPADALDVLRAFIYLRANGRTERALQIFEKTVHAGNVSFREPAFVELYKMAGQAYFELKKYNKAADAMAVVERVLNSPDEYGFDDAMVELIQGGDPATLSELMGRIYLEAGQSKKARAAFQRATEKDPGGRLYWSAKVMAAEKQHVEALAELEKYFTQKYTSRGDEPYREFFELSPAKHDAKLERLEKLVSQDPDNVDLAYFVSEQYLAKNEQVKAQQLIKQYIDEKPTLDAYRNLVRIAHEQDDFAGFLDLASSICDRYAGLSLLGKPFLQLAADAQFVEGLIATAKKRLAQDPATLDFGDRLAVALTAAEAKRWDKAGEYFKLAMLADPMRRAELYEVWGLRLLEAERHQDAITLFREAIREKLLPDDEPVFHYYLSGALADAEQWEQAIKTARHATESAPDSVDFLFRLGWTCYRARNNDRAITIFRKFIDRFDSQRDSSTTRDLVREVRLALSHLYSLQKDVSAAEELLAQVLDEFPDDYGAMNDLGYLWADRGILLDRAQELIEAACESEPDNMAYRDSLGWVLFRRGRVKEAVVELEEAVRLAEKELAEGELVDGVILDHLADACQALGRAEEAKVFWKRAVDAFVHSEDSDEAARVREKLESSDRTGPDNP